MAEGGRVLGWGLWNERLTEWFNPMGKRPYFRTREEAELKLPLAQRQYSMGKWEVREYRAESELGEETAEPMPAPA
jgi:hypothetical protein